MDQQTSENKKSERKQIFTMDITQEKWIKNLKARKRKSFDLSLTHLDWHYKRLFASLYLTFILRLKKYFT